MTTLTNNGSDGNHGLNIVSYVNYGTGIMNIVGGTFTNIGNQAMNVGRGAVGAYGEFNLDRNDQCSSANGGRTQYRT